MIGTPATVRVGNGFSQPTIEVRWDIRAGYENDTRYIRISDPFLRDPIIPASGSLPSDPIVFIESDDPRAIEARAYFAKHMRRCYLGFLGDEYDWYRERASQLEDNFIGVLIKDRVYVAMILQWMTYTFTIMLSLYFVIWFIIYSTIKSRYRRSLTRLCPSCSYNIEGVTSPQCPECGLNIESEAKLLNCLREQGYRGLKRFMAMEREGAK